MASHLASLWNRGLKQYFTITANGADKRLQKLEGDMKLMQRDGIMMGTLDTLSLKMPK